MVWNLQKWKLDVQLRHKTWLNCKHATSNLIHVTDEVIHETRGGCNVGLVGAQAPTEKKNYPFLFKRKINKFLNNLCQIIK